MTSFGSPWSNVERTAAVLRGAAAAAGCELRRASQTELAAAVLGAHALGLLTGTPTTAIKAAYSPAVTAAVAAVLARAAGSGGEATQVSVISKDSVPAAAHRVIEELGTAVKWVSEYLPDHADDVWQLCASDLSAGAGLEGAGALEWVAAWCLDQASA